MPYNTRRKSVSLSSLGIHVPSSSRASSHRSPPATATAITTTSSLTMPPTGEQPPAKKVKRSHTSGSPAPLSPSSPPSPSRPLPPKFSDDRPRSGGLASEVTPPPEGFKVDTEGIIDEIVVGVIEQLEKTGNRPHLLKELAAILQHTIAIVTTSANQPAIISSRLATYMKRPWTALAPCPLGKELVGTHPKRIYFYLKTQPRQAFPDPPETQAQQARIISPSLTSAENEDEDKDARQRSALSPSPELELELPDLERYESPMSANDTFPTSHLLSHISTHDSSTSSLTHGQMSPPLEGDEREFTQTATSLQQRRRSESMEMKVDSTPAVEVQEVAMDGVEESEESRALYHRSDAAALFGQPDSHLTVTKPIFMESSPMLRPQADVDMTFSFGTKMEIHDVKLVDDFSGFLCETVDMEELDNLFESY